MRAIKKNNRLFWICIMLLLAASGTVLVTVFAADVVISDRILLDFEDGELGTASLSDDAVAEVTEQEPIGGARSLRLKSGTVSWKELSLDGYTMSVAFKVKCPSDFQTRLDLKLDTEGVNGGSFTALSLEPSGETINLTSGGNTLYELSYNTVYKLQISFRRGEDSFAVYVNDTQIESSPALPGRTYGINGTALSVGEAGESSFVLIDDLRVYTESKSYPQLYSAQAPGALPELAVPDAADADGTALYINGVRINFDRPLIVRDDTVYVPGERLFDSVGIDCRLDADSGIATLSGENLNMIFTVGSTIATVNGTNIVLTAAPIQEDDLVYVPLNLINEAFNAKVWWDEDAGLVAVTTGKAKSDHVLRSLRGRLYMDGEPYYEISFLYDTLAGDIWQACRDGGDAYEQTELYREARDTVAELRQKGFRSVRTYMWNDSRYQTIHSAADREMYFQSVDIMMDLLDEYGLRLIPCLGLNSKMFLSASYVDDYGWVLGNETVTDLIADPDSSSRYAMGTFLDEFIKRFKDRGTVLFWELCNGANLDADCGAGESRVAYSLLQLSRFYSDCAARIRSIDDSRLISGGDSMLRPAQWHLFKAIMAGSQEDWNYDNTEERLQALALLCADLDIISMHGYNVGVSTNAESYYADEEGNKIQLAFGHLISEARRLGKALYSGAGNGSVEYTSADGQSEDRLDGINRYLDTLVEGGVQLSYWQIENGDRLSAAFLKENGLSEAVAAADIRLRERYTVNKASSANTDQSWSDAAFDVFDPAALNPGEVNVIDMTFWYGLLKIAVAMAAAVLLLTAVIYAMKKKENSFKRSRRFHE